MTAVTLADGTRALLELCGCEGKGFTTAPGLQRTLNLLVCRCEEGARIWQMFTRGGTWREGYSTGYSTVRVGPGAELDLVERRFATRHGLLDHPVVEIRAAMLRHTGPV